MEEKTILVNKLRINYCLEGEGEPVLILHGWGASLQSWLEVQELLADDGFKVIIPDLPGFGKSAPPPEPWGIKDYTLFLLKLAEALNLSGFWLLGHSFGGRIAIKFATSHPQKLKGLILCNSAGIKPQPSLKTKIIFQISKIGNGVFSPQPLKRLKDRARNIFYFFLGDRDYPKAKGVMRETIKRVLEEDLLPELSRIEAKTLIVWGQKDRMVPVKYAHIFKKRIAFSELKILPQIGHSPNLESPEKLSEIILDFFKAP